MKRLINTQTFVLTAVTAFSSLFGQNQTETLSPVLPQTSLPFTLQVDTAPFSLPTGLQGYAGASYDGKWILLAGRTNGLHGFDNVGNNFPPRYQNTTVYVVDPKTGNSWSRPLTDASSKLNQDEIDTLSVVAPEFFQKGKTLYIVGGYGINTNSDQMETKTTLTALDLEKLTKWVLHGSPSVASAMKQVSDPFLQVTGGALFQDTDHSPFLLIMGQNFAGLYRDDSNGAYTQEIRPFWLIEENNTLAILPKEPLKITSDYRRRDLNVVPILHKNQFAYTAFAGVFTLDNGVWTVPVVIQPDGSSREPNPNSAKTFKQAMNQYNCATIGLYSTKNENMYVIFAGGISYGYFSSGTFQTDSEFPFINQITTVKVDSKNNYQQYLMDAEYPYIVSTGSNPGNQLLFGAEALFFPEENTPLYRNGVIQLDKITEPTVIGYIAGGIMSTLPNTNFSTDSTSSPYVFAVTLVPR